VVARGDQLRAGLLDLAQTHPGIGDVRGPGLMVATEFMDTAGRPDAARVQAVIAHCRDQGHLLLMNAGTDGNVIRWMPPLVVTADEIDTALETFAKALAGTAP
jgi:4-aminobutyrate aminotransferase-like enzyme